MDVRVRPKRRLRTEELMLLNCGAGEDSRDSRRQQGNQTNQSYNKSTLIFIGRTDAEAEAPILWPPDVKSLLIEKTLLLEKIDSRRRKRSQRMRWSYGTTNSMDMSLSKLWEIVKDRAVWRATVHGVGKSRT